MLSDGGTAVDAAVAAAFADAVMQPFASGIGGGGSAIVWADGEAINLDYRDLVNQSGVVPQQGAGIPGLVAGLAELHSEFGKLEWAEVLKPAISLAAEGAPVSDFLAARLAAPLGKRVTSALPHFRKDGAQLVAGDVLVQTELAQTMQAIADGGADAFYTGELVPALTRIDGIDADSLAGYTTQRSDPPRGPVGDYEMLSASPALPGAALIQMVQIAEAGGVATMTPGSADFIDLQSRAWQVADKSVQTLFGDPAFVNVPTAELTDPAANALLAETLAPAEVSSVSSPYTDSASNTTHISVVDADGMAVSMTNTVTGYWGSGQYVAGFFMNDQLLRFDAIGTGEANIPSPGRRSVSWSSPSMLLDKQGRPALIIGSPGGRQIPNSLAAVITRWALQGQSLDEAIPAERFLLDQGVLRLETEALASEMRSRGYTVEVAPEATRYLFGSVQALEVDWDAGAVSGVADSRRSGAIDTGVR